MQLSNPSSVAASVTDAIPFDSIPIDRVTELTLDDVGEVWNDASDLVADSAIVITKHGGRLARRTARGVWRNRTSVATVVILALAVVGLVTLMKRDTTDEDTV